MRKLIDRFLDNQIVQNVLIGFLVLGGVINIFTPQIDFFIKSAQLANQILFVYLFLGILFLLLSKQRLMMTSFIIAGCLALFIKNTTSARIKFAKPNTGEKFNVSLINLSSIDSEPNKVFENIIKNQHDLVVFQEYTPDWEKWITEKLSQSMLYQVSLPRIDIYGLNILSKYPISDIDTIQYEEVPILKLTLHKGGEKTVVLTTYFAPPINNELSHKNQEQLHMLSSIIKNNNLPTIVISIFNQVPWSQEMIAFKNENQLTFANTGFIPSMDKSSGGLFGKPVTFIMFSPELECTKYRASKADNDEYGIESTLQYKLLK